MCIKVMTNVHKKESILREGDSIALTSSLFCGNMILRGDNVIEKNYIVTKRNVLNEVRNNNMTLQELRLFSVYLSKIDIENTQTKRIEFNVEDFRDIFDIKRLNKAYLKDVFEKLLNKKITLQTEKGICSFVLFQYCEFFEDTGIVEICASDKALPFLFGFKERYFSYRLYNALNLKSSNQLRFYEILKQFENAKTRIVSIDELKMQLGLDTHYEEFKHFKRDVIVKCQKALKESTDICFEYETIRKGRKVDAIKFFIYKNSDFVNDFKLEKFINEKSQNIITEEILEIPTLDKIEVVLSDDEADDDEPFEFATPTQSVYTTKIDLGSDYDNDDLQFLAEACNEDFNNEEMKVILQKLVQITIPPMSGIEGIDFQRYHYLAEKYANLELACSKTPIKNKLRYFLKMLEN